MMLKKFEAKRVIIILKDFKDVNCRLKVNLVFGFVIFPFLQKRYDFSYK